MDISEIYIHDAVLLQVVEDTEADTLIMSVMLPASPSSDDFVPRLMIFEDVHSYQVFEGPFKGSPAILEMQIVEKRNGWHRIRIDTNAGHRELYCTSLRVIEAEI